MADPNAIQVVTACAAAFDQVGMPEGRFHLALAALYLATAKKSNSTFAFFDALATVEKEADSGVPDHLRDANRDTEGFGHGEGYLYPHAFRDHWVAQQYLPASLQGKVFYQPSDQGYEAGIAATVARRREAQLAAMLALDGVDSGRGDPHLHRGQIRRATAGCSAPSPVRANGWAICATACWMRPPGAPRHWCWT